MRRTPLFVLACILVPFAPACAAGTMTSGTGQADTIDDGDTDGGDDDDESDDDDAQTDADDDDDGSEAPSDDDAGSSEDDGTDATSEPVEGSTDEGGSDDASSGGLEESTGDGGESTGEETGGPATVDLSGFSVSQTDSDREIVIPDGTIIPVGGALVVGRNATLGEFEDFWGVTLGDDVVYIDGIDVFPACNGDETFTLRSPLRTIVDGPTPALTISTLLERTDASMPADNEGAWVSSALPNSDATPGTGVDAGGETGVPYISEIVDATGSGNFAYEFVEIRIAS